MKSLGRLLDKTKSEWVLKCLCGAFLVGIRTSMRGKRLQTCSQLRYVDQAEPRCSMRSLCTFILVRHACVHSFSEQSECESCCLWQTGLPAPFLGRPGSHKALSHASADIPPSLAPQPFLRVPLCFCTDRVSLPERVFVFMPSLICSFLLLNTNTHIKLNELFLQCAWPPLMTTCSGAREECAAGKRSCLKWLTYNNVGVGVKGVHVKNK